MFVGMDLHKNYLQIAVMNEKGKVLENSRIKNNLRTWPKLANLIHCPRITMSKMYAPIATLALKPPLLPTPVDPA